MRKRAWANAVSMLALMTGAVSFATPASAQTGGAPESDQAQREQEAAPASQTATAPQEAAPGLDLSPSDEFPVVMLPPGYNIEKVVDGLTYPTSITWDDQGRMYVAEAGGAFLEEEPPARILRVEENGELTEIANLDEKGIMAAVTGLTWHDGLLYFTHRAEDLTGAVSRMTMDGEVTLLVSGIVDSQTDHQVNDIRVGPDGRIYFTSGAGGNSGVMGEDMTPFVVKNPDTHTTACNDIVLTGRNFHIPNYLTDDPGDYAVTGAFVPFGTPTQSGQVIEGRTRCGGAILVFDVQDIEGTLQPYAWGFRNVIGLAWGEDGEMYATQNGYDQVPPRPIIDEYDPTYRVREGAWYGAPDFSAALEPVTDPKFQPPGQLHAPVSINGVAQERELGFLIDHEASGLEPPDRSLVLGLHPINSSPSKPDVAPESWGEMAGQLFVPEWGDMAWFTDALRDDPAGSRIVVIDTESGELSPFIQNAKPGPASAQGAAFMGIERPFDVKFGPDGAMYIVDFGQHAINLKRIAEGRLPFEWPAETGIVWKVTAAEGDQAQATAAQGAGPAAAKPLTTPEFVALATASNLFEIESSQQAVDKAANAELKEFAQKMIQDHTMATAEMKSAMEAGNVKSPMPHVLDPKHQKMLRELQDTSGADFDKHYVDMQLKAHEEAVGLFRSYAADGENEALRGFAEKTLPVLGQHLERIEGIQAER